MIDQNGKIKFPPEFLRKNKRSLIESNEQVTVNNIKCPNCNGVVIVSEAFTKPCALPNGITVPAFDEDGVMIGECIGCSKEFAVDVINPEFSEFISGADKKDHYFIIDGKDKQEQYKNLIKSENKIGGDEKLKKYSLNYIYDEYPLYICNDCGENLESLAFNELKSKFHLLEQEHYNYVSWSLKNARGQSPEYLIVKVGFICACGNECNSFFFKKYVETASLNIEEFSICNIVGSQDINDRIGSGVYSKNNSVSWLYKLIPRWTLLFDKVYIITPFVGHQWLKSYELMDTWLELVNRLDHKKSKILLKYGQLSKFKKVYSEESDVPYEMLSEYELGSDILSELKQTNDFHAKVYCGVSRQRCEVFSGSANLVRGKSMEVMHFNVFTDFDKFNESFLEPLGIKEKVNFPMRTYSLFFESNENFNVFRGKGTLDSDDYKNVILSGLG